MKFHSFRVKFHSEMDEVSLEKSKISLFSSETIITLQRVNVSLSGYYNRDRKPYFMATLHRVRVTGKNTDEWAKPGAKPGEKPTSSKANYGLTFEVSCHSIP